MSLLFDLYNCSFSFFQSLQTANFDAPVSSMTSLSRCSLEFSLLANSFFFVKLCFERILSFIYFWLLDVAIICHSRVSGKNISNCLFILNRSVNANWCLSSSMVPSIMTTRESTVLKYFKKKLSDKIFNKQNKYLAIYNTSNILKLLLFR